MRFKNLASQAELEFTPYSLMEISKEVRDTYFPTQTVKDVHFTRLDIFAVITFPLIEGAFEPYIAICSYLNHPDTPQYVIDHIIKHEYLHVEIPPRLIDGKTVCHPPEFWEKEREISPEANDMWDWIYTNFIGAFRRDKKNEKYRVFTTKYKEYRWRDRPTSPIWTA